MKKFLAIFTAILTVLALAACKNEAKDEPKGVKVTLLEEAWYEDGAITVDFYYPEDADITLERFDEDQSWVDMHYESKNITISPALCEDTTYEENKAYDKENEETYKEFKIKGYDCYGYEAFGG